MFGKRSWNCRKCFVLRFCGYKSGSQSKKTTSDLLGDCREDKGAAVLSWSLQRTNNRSLTMLTTEWVVPKGSPNGWSACPWSCPPTGHWWPQRRDDPCMQCLEKWSDACEWVPCFSVFCFAWEVALRRFQGMQGEKLCAIVSLWWQSLQVRVWLDITVAWDALHRHILCSHWQPDGYATGAPDQCRSFILQY